MFLGSKYAYLATIISTRDLVAVKDTGAACEAVTSTTFISESEVFLDRFDPGF